MKKTTKWFISTLVVISAIALGACGGGGNSNDDDARTGQFIDAPVEGLEYRTGGETRVTDANGNFRYLDGDLITFFVGVVEIGQTDGAPIITPVDLVPGAVDETNETVTNIIRFLQTLDEDDDLSNGIAITETVRALALNNSPINFEQSVEDFEDDGDIQALVAELTAATLAGPRTLRSVQEAREHFSETLLGLVQGTYAGTYSGDANGRWGFLVNAEGVVSGVGIDDEANEVFDITGTLSTSGSLRASGTADQSTWEGSITNDTITGTWQSNDGDQGTFTGQVGGNLPSTGDANDGANGGGTRYQVTVENVASSQNAGICSNFLPQSETDTDIATIEELDGGNRLRVSVDGEEQIYTRESAGVYTGSFVGQEINDGITFAFSETTRLSFSDQSVSVSGESEFSATIPDFGQVSCSINFSGSGTVI